MTRSCRAHRFTNAYRAADRVSQYLIRHVAYEGDQTAEEVVFRVLLFKFFNKIATWERLRDAFGAPSARSFSVDEYDAVLTRAFARGDRLYSAAYIMPAAAPGVQRKHLTHLRLLRTMLDDRLPQRLSRRAPPCGPGTSCCSAIVGIGPFLAYQLVTDLNYTSVLGFSEMEFVVAGPGARSGLRKCFADFGDYEDADLIRYIAERQDHEFGDARNPDFEDLWGGRCSSSTARTSSARSISTARVVHPDVRGVGGRTRIKQTIPAGRRSRRSVVPP